MSSEAFKAEADKKLNALAAKQEQFGNLGPVGKAQLLGELMQAMKNIQDELPALGDACVTSQGWDDPRDERATIPWAVEQLLLVQWMMNFCTRYKANCETLAKTGKPTPAKSLQTRSDGRVVADVFPLDSGDGMKPNKKWTCQLWMQPGKGASQGAEFNHKPRPNSVGLVLGAGNVMALGVMDCMHLLFQHNTVVLLKLHPIRTYPEGILRNLMAPLISKGYFEIIKEENGLPDSAYLCSHPLLCNLHMTGATETHDCIVWGPKGERAKRIQNNEPLIDIRNRVNFTSELGCVTPYMVCPGKWEQSEITHHALHLAVSLTGNNGYYCNSPKVLILAEDWPQKDAFIGTLKGILSGLPPVPPYYPGTAKRYSGFQDAYGERMEQIKGPGFGQKTKFGDELPWGIVHTSADPQNLDASMSEYAFRNEPFAPMITICTLKGVATAEQYLQAAPNLANKCIWGRLSCSLVVHPSTQASAPAAVDQAIAELEYGAIVINAWSGLAYGYECGVWGAYAGGDPPRERIECLESGLGFVNNCLAFDHIEKAVVTCPFIDKDNQLGTGPTLTRPGLLNLTNFLINPGLGSLLKMLAPGLFTMQAKLGLTALGVAAIGGLLKSRL